MFGAFNMSPPFEVSHHPLALNSTSNSSSSGIMEHETMSMLANTSSSMSPTSRKFGPRKLARCLAIGMQPCEVRSNGLGGSSSSNGGGPSTNANPPRPQDSPSNHSDQASSSSSSAQSPQLNGMQQAICEMFNVPQDTSNLTTLLNSKREVIFNRAKLGMYNGNTLPPPSEYKQAESFCLLRAMILESAVCTAFLNSSGLSDYLSGRDQQTLLDQALTTWINMDVCNLTARNNGVEQDRAFCINDQFVDVNLQFLEKMYGLDKSIRSAQWIARLQKPFWQKVLDLAKLLENSKLDEYEFAALAQLTLIRIACESSGNVSETQMNLAPYVANLMKDIQQYYTDNYSTENATIKLGTLVQLVSEMQELRTIYNKHVMILFLSHQRANDDQQVGPSWMPILNQEELVKVASTGARPMPNGLASILASTTISPQAFSSNFSSIPSTAAPSPLQVTSTSESLNYLLLSNNITSISQQSPMSTTLISTVPKTFSHLF
uniref:NR LBD domain-containing protein n=1 Tax=Panagrolaimus superbus TaxID=310955 RepID=A0A914YAH2_9BILA